MGHVLYKIGPYCIYVIQHFQNYKGYINFLFLMTDNTVKLYLITEIKWSKEK